MNATIYLVTHKDEDDQTVIHSQGYLDCEDAERAEIDTETEIAEVEVVIGIPQAIAILKSEIANFDEERFDRLMESMKLVINCRHCSCKNCRDAPRCVGCHKPLF